MNIYVAIACLLATASADGPLGLGDLGGLVYAPGHASADYYAYPRYAFEYAVKDPHTGDNKAQWEKRDGDVVKGAYSLVEPDGSLRVVEYWADDKSGFNAVVKRLGANVHPPTVHAAPIYKAPIPVLSSGPVLSPISIGPVANLGHLAAAPLLSGPIKGAISTQSLIKQSVPIAKTVISAAPILHEPIVPVLPAPLIKQAPILPLPIYKAGPIYSEALGPAPIYKAPLPVYKSGPIYSEVLGPVPIYKAPLPVYKAPLPVYKEALPLPLLKGPLGPWDDLGRGPIGPWAGLEKESIGPFVGLEKIPISPLYLGGGGLVKGPIGPLGYDLIGKGPLLPEWNGPLEYPLIEKH